VRAVEDHSGTFATLQVNSNSMGLKYGPTWVDVEHLGSFRFCLNRGIPKSAAF
jgi:hypothetical protein